MPTTLLTVQTRDMSSAVLERVNAAMLQLTRSMQDQGVTARQALTIASQQESASTRYASLLERAATATQQYEAATLRVNSAQRQQLDIAASLGRYSDEYTAAVQSTNTALEQAASRGLKMADVYRQLNTVETQLLRTQQQTTAMLSAPLKEPAGITTPATTTESTAAAGGSKTLLGGLKESFLGQYILYGIGYQIGSQLISGLQSSLTDNQQLSVSAGQTAASTGLGPGGVNWLQTYAEQQAGSGTQPYNAQTVLAGAYGPLSQGFKSKAQATGITNTAIGLSQIAGAPDISTASNAILSLGNAFGWGTNTATSSRQYANLLQAGTNIGAYTLGSISQSLPNAGLKGLSNSGFSPQFVMAAIASESYANISPELAAQNLNSLNQSITNPKVGQTQAARAMGMQIGPGAFQQAGGAANWFMELQNHSAAMTTAVRQQMFSKLFGNQNAGALVTDMLGNTGPRGFENVYRYMQGAGQGKGYYQTALSTEQSTPGQKLVDAETKLTQSMDTLTKSLLPVEQQMVVGLNNAVTALNNLVPPVEKLAGLSAPKPGSTAGFAPGTPMTTYNIPNFLHNLTGWGLPSSSSTAPRLTPSAHTTLVGAGPLLPGETRVMARTVPAGMIGPLAPGETRSLADAMGSVAKQTQALQVGMSQTAHSPYTAQQQQYAANARAMSVATGGSGTLAMQNSLDSFKAAMLTYASPQSVEGLYNSYVKAVQADKGLTAPQRQLDIATQQHAFMNYTAGWAKHLVMPPFFNPNPGMGGLNAGFGATAVRFGGGQDPTQALIQKLEQRISQDNTTIKNLLSQIAANTTRTQFNTAHTTPLAGTGTNRSPHS